MSTAVRRDTSHVILNAEPIHYAPEARALLSQIGTVLDGPFTRDELRERLRDATVLLVRLGHAVDRELLRRATLLQYIVSPTTGLDHIDLGYAQSRGIEVLSLRGETAFLESIRATSELTWALLLALVRRLPGAFANALSGSWSRDEFRGAELAGRRLGIVGLGRIGRTVARYGLSFDMDVFAFDTAGSSIPGVTLAPSLDELLGSADVLTIHVPLTDTTRGMIGSRELGLLPDGAILLNTSRGSILDERAVVRALRAGKLAGVAVDVLEGERDSRALARSPLLNFARAHPERAIITPHIGGATWESMHRTELFMAQRLVARITMGSRFEQPTTHQTSQLSGKDTRR